MPDFTPEGVDFPKAVRMPQVVPLMFQDIEGLIFYVPPGTLGPHDVIDILLGEIDVRYPGEPSRGIACIIGQPVLKEVAPQ